MATKGGFRISGRRGARRRWVVLYTTSEDANWPDTLDPATGRFVYFGDNRSPGHELHETTRGGNRLLRDVFESIHGSGERRADVPPFLIFEKASPDGRARAVRFRGLAVPGYPGLTAVEDLVAVWKSTNGSRFQNYRAVFTILDAAVVSRIWLNDLASGDGISEFAPEAWRDWIATGRHRTLVAEPTTTIRGLEEQRPATDLGRRILTAVHERFRDDSRGFEAFAARLYAMTDARVRIDEITRGVGDGGRDALGRYRLGVESDPVFVDFALEAKCYRPPGTGVSATTVGVRDVARLVSRLRHRQFGVLVTTSVVAPQTYAEVRADRHPIVFLCGRDLAEILIAHGYGSVEATERFLSEEFPR